MTPEPIRPALLRLPAPARAVRPVARLGVPFLLFMVWLWFEYGRPTHPLGIPLVISAILLGSWLVAGHQYWNRQSSLFVAFLAVIAAGIPFAANTFSAFWSLYSMATTLVCLCIPMPFLIRSVRHVRVWIYAFVAVALYVGVWAIFSGGYGPSGAAGGQDENYVAAMMGMAVAFAYFSFFAAKSKLGKIVLAVSIPVFLTATLAGQNVSRGGFVGLCAVFLYCLVRSPRKILGITILIVIVAVVAPFAGSDYWDEILSISDVHEGTADMRLEIWQIGIRMWQAHPLVGVGAGNFRWMVGLYQSDDQLEKYGRDLGGSIIAHSLFVELLAELGIAGVLVLVMLVWRTFSDLATVIRHPPAADADELTRRDAAALRCYADAVIAGIIAVLVNGAFLSLLYYSYLWLFAALGGAIWRLTRPTARVPQTA